MNPESPGSLLCVSNYRANIGYAWHFIECLYAGIADRVAAYGVRTLVAYPSIPDPPRALVGSAARAIVLDASLDTLQSIRVTEDVIRRENVRVVYFSARPARRWVYLRLRRAGVEQIIVHVHSSGRGTPPQGLKVAAKWALARIPGMVADVVVAVSDYVARREVQVGLIKPGRVITVWNGVPVTGKEIVPYGAGNDILGLAGDRPVVVCSCRASREKGVVHLLRAFDRVAQAFQLSGQRPVLVYLGDGPQIAELRSLRESLLSKDDIILAGYRSDVPAILQRASLCVVPSVWQEAFGLAVLEAMASGKAVIASKVGGIPEMIEHHVTGLLVPPADETALAQAIYALLTDPSRAARLGVAARQRVTERFTLEHQMRTLSALVAEGFGLQRGCQTE